MTLQAFGIILAALLGFTATISSTMVLFALNTMKERIGKLERDQQVLFGRKIECGQDYVGKVEYIRAVNAIEESMKELIQNVAQMNGTMRVIEQMPQICGNIAKEIVREMKHNG